MKHNCSTLATVNHSRKNETITLIVVVLTLVTMAVEIIAGLISGSMALLSDGIHMGTHSVALFITLAAYIFARRNNDNPLFAFGTGKVGVLGGYTNAILLLVASAAMAAESIERLINPVTILFNEAIIVAVIGLVVNVVSAFILGYGNEGHHHGHHHEHPHPHEHHHDHHQDHNLKSAYLHVITDALTSILAIGALLTGKYFGLNQADPIVGILGALVIGKWAVGLLKQTSRILLDKSDSSKDVQSLRNLIESDSTRIRDLHLWPISENKRSLILSIETSKDFPSSYYHGLVKQAGNFEHITIEIHHCSSGAPG